MQENNLTDWFPPEVKPVHVGPYLTRREEASEGTFYSFWDGKSWLLDAASPDEATNLPDDMRFSSHDQSRPWKGLLK